MKKYLRVSFLAVAIFTFLAYISPVAAQSLLPDQIGQIFGLLGPEGSGSAGFVTSRVQLGLVIALGIVVLIAVVYAIAAAIKYISSQGDAGKIEEAQKAIQAIFLGVGAMLIAIVGIVLVFVFFGASQPSPELFQVCLSSPNSVGCASCLAGDDAIDPASPTGAYSSTQCGVCEQAYACVSGDTNACTGSAATAGDPDTVPAECKDPLNQ